MALHNTLTWAVAGGRKTQQLVDACASTQATKLRLALTFTLTGQAELSKRLAGHCPPDRRPEVSGWYTFLISHWVRPYLGHTYEDMKVAGFNFGGSPGRFATGRQAYFDQDCCLYRRNLARLAVEVNRDSGGKVIKRLERIYSEIYIDEVQDLCGWDLEVIKLLLNSSISIQMVGDPRQCVYSTNPQDLKNKQFRGMQIIKWFDLQKSVETKSSSITYRSSQAIADLADSVFPSTAGFDRTTSRQTARAEHEGVFWLHPQDLNVYYSQHNPLVLAWDKSARESLQLPAKNFGDVKGLTTQHVVIKPTGPILKFLNQGTPLAEISSCKLYVALTRAIFSVAFLSDKPVGKFSRWVP